jgi:AcrR family transcriptional regulator
MRKFPLAARQASDYPRSHVPVTPTHPVPGEMSEPSAAPRIARSRQSRTQNTREVILRAASNILGQRGYEASSIDDVAQEAGVTKATVYYHFASKDDLYVAVRIWLLAEAGVTATTAIEECDEPVLALGILIDQTIILTMDRHRRYVFFHERISLRPELRQALAAAQREYGEIGERVVAAGQAKGEVIEGSPNMIVNIFLGTIARTPSWYRETGEVGPEAFSRLLRSFILNGVLTEAGRAKLIALG